jgi:hypothetical protein
MITDLFEGRCEKEEKKRKKRMEEKKKKKETRDSPFPPLFSFSLSFPFVYLSL